MWDGRLPLSTDFEGTLDWITHCHEGQTRWDGSPYVNHPIRVSKRVRLEKHKIVGLLHDVVEDCGVSLDDLKKMGYDRSVVAGVNAVTRRDGESYAEFIKRCSKNAIGLEVKIADIEDNIADNLKKGQRKDKYEIALMYLKHIKRMHRYNGG